MKAKRILAVASAGGHWVQLRRLSPAWKKHELHYATTAADTQNIDGSPVHVITDANRWERLKLIKMVFEIIFLMIKLRPDVVVTTGAAPGLIAILVGRITGARTLWIDSIANSEVLSGSGQIARKLAHACLTQWPHLAEDNVEHWGAIL